MSKRRRTDVEEFSESGETDTSDSSMISPNDSDRNEELGVKLYLHQPETNTDGNANITGRHNEKGLMFLCLSCQDIKSDTVFY